VKRPAISRKLLAWYDRHRRDLPWRALPGATADPYRVWLSEIMLQQTTVAAVKGYFERFTARWPNVEALADAPLDDVLTAWAGLGYYARARNLKRCAETVAHDLGGQFPSEEASLRALPGVGEYTAAAIAAIAYGQSTNVVDGNVERVVARLFAEETPLPAAKKKLRELAATLVPAKRGGDHAQALMDLGATICTPRSPNCLVCPLRDDCLARQRGIAETLPRRAPKAERPVRHGVAFWLEREDGAVLLRRRPERGLLGGMIEVPSTPWRAQEWTLAEALGDAPVAAQWRELDDAVEHTFTHFHLVLRVVRGRAAKASGVNGLWHKPRDAAGLALPSVMKKIFDAALGDDTAPPKVARSARR
jgi:A/G-specific adenine glycosylase